MTPRALRDLVQTKLGDRLLVVVSNRQPYIHTLSGEDIRCSAPVGGLTAALEPVMRACGGTWVAHGCGNADREVVDANNTVAVPPDAPQYSLRRVWLSKDQQQGYYHGFANQALWPLCHVAYVRPRFEEAHWNAYKAVNELFAEAILSEVNGRDAFVFVQDYHLALLPRLIKERAPNVVTSQFWHIPWPNPETFRIFPWRKEVLDGLLGNDLLGFQIRNHCNNFLATVDRTLEARLDYERNDIVRGGRRTAVRPFPISIDFHQVCQDSQLEEVDEEIDRLRGQYWLDRQCIGLGLDRIDYTKGIPDRLRAFDRFLTLYPEYHGKVVLVQVGAPSRTDIVSYQTLNDELDRLVEDINGRHGDRRWRPVVYLPEDLPQVTLLALRRLAHFALVSSLQDGMNLVAKEFVASRFDDDGVLILSRFTGAARELSDALLVNPYATDEFALAIKTAVDMPLAERQRRMRRMRQVVRENNVYDWAGAIVSELARLAMR